MIGFTIGLRDGTPHDPRPPTADTAPPPDGGYAVDGDLNQMTDDGCPHNPDPTRWADPDWRDEPAAESAGGRDNLGALDTFSPPPAPADSHWQRLRDRSDLTERWLLPPLAGGI
jgi:hypothetical protein